MINAQKYFTRVLSYFAVIFTLSLLVACSASAQNAILGKWTEIDGTEKMEFFNDGTMTVTDKGLYAGGKYAFVEKNRLKVDLGNMGLFVVTVSIEGNKLTWTMPNGKISKYSRVN